MPKAGDFYNGGLRKNSSSVVESNGNCFKVYLKPLNNWGEFELDWARCNKNIDGNSFALGNKKDSRSSFHKIADLSFFL